MQLEDIPDVTAIERQSFTTPWPAYAYRREISDNRNSRYIVVRRLDGNNGYATPSGESTALPRPDATAEADVLQMGHDSTAGLRAILARLWPFSRPAVRTSEAVRRGAVVGYAGLWLVLDEAHVTTIAVRPDLRGQGLGELLLVRLFESAQEMGADRVTLEVRMSNKVAQNLYRKYTFTEQGVRRRYYSDDNEDALIMTTASLPSPEFRSKFPELRAALHRRFGSNLVRQ